MLGIVPAEGAEIVEFVDLQHSNQNEQFDVFDEECEFCADD